MSQQLSLLDRPGIAGMGEAASHADPSDLASVRAILEDKARLGEPFTIEDVMVGLPQWRVDRLAAYPNALGGLMYQAQKDGRIEGVGYAPATRKEARGRPIRLWRGTNHGEPK